MDKLKLLLLVCLLIVSCGKQSNEKDQESNEKINIAKSKLKSIEVPEIDIENTKFEVFEVSDKDAYSFLVKAKTKSQSISFRKETEAELNAFLDTLKTATGKKVFTKIFYYRIAGDTVSKGYIILNDTNKIIGCNFLK